MLKNLYSVAISIAAMVAVVWVYHNWFAPEPIVYVNHGSIPEAPVRLTNFSSEQAVLASDIFVEPAQKGIISSVFIRSIHEKYNDATTGSGVIISYDGYIATNYHVVRQAKNIEVTLHNNRVFQGTLIGFDEHTDLALLKIETTDVKAISFADSDSLQIGEWVLAVGSPFRLQSTVTAGIVSAKSRNINIMKNTAGIESYIQTDAAVNPGNSGGALLNSSGSLVGINTAIMASSGNYEGYSFAIPINLAKKIFDDIKSYGAVQRGWLGITTKNINQSLATELNLQNVQGVYVIQVNKDQSAYLAGIESGDVLVEINKETIDNTSQFMELVGRHRPGDTIQLRYIRDGQQFTTDAALLNKLNSTDFVAVRKDPILTKNGIEARDLTTTELERLTKKGVYVVSVKKGTSIGNTNMDPGYIITHANNQRIKDVQSLLTFLQGAAGEITLEGYYENYPGQFSYLFYLR